MATSAEGCTGQTREAWLLMETGTEGDLCT